MSDSRTDITSQDRVWDVFISQASEDKENFARPLAERLRSRRLEVWFDEFTLRVGDSLRRSIDQGLQAARYGVVILSPAFFRKEWPQKELDALASREIEGHKVILPIWHDLDAATIRHYSPMLADRYALRSNAGIEAVVEALLEVVHPSPERPVEEATWLKAALIIFDAESESAKERWLFHLEAAERAGRIAVRIEGNTHYDTADRLHRLGALVEIADDVQRSPSHLFLTITDKGRILLEVLRAKGQLN